MVPVTPLPTELHQAMQDRRRIRASPIRALIRATPPTAPGPNGAGAAGPAIGAGIGGAGETPTGPPGPVV
eukprot:548179-Alexandrium_andersonii.AAC.1